MCQFVETIRIKNGEAMNLQYHAERLNRTRKHFWPEAAPIAADDLLTDIPQTEGLQKARVVYDASGIVLRKFHPYAIRDVRMVKVVIADDIDYTWKSTDRSPLTQQRDKAKDYDEVIIVKNGCVTDTSYTNICFYDGSEWLTPDTPLLRGTMRQHLLDTGQIREAHITADAIPSFQKISLINAMMDLGDLVITQEQITY